MGGRLTLATTAPVSILLLSKWVFQLTNPDNRLINALRSTENAVFPAWPIPNTSYQKLYLQAKNDSGSSLSVDTGLGLSTYRSDVPVIQHGDDPEELSFEYLFETRTYVVGYSRVILYTPCDKYNNLIYLFSHER